jgi:hypothetical protein
MISPTSRLLTASGLSMTKVRSMRAPFWSKIVSLFRGIC